MTTTDDGKLDNMTVRRFAKLLKSSDTNTSTPITTGKVVKNDNSLYVAIDDDTLVPISDTSATVNVGDVVTIALTDETGLIVGNNTDKSVATTNLTKTANGLKLDIEGKASKAELTLESDKLQSSITDTKKDLNNTITQTAEGLTVKITNAQNTADTAKTNAATAQTTADAAKTAAATAQTSADDARKVATNYLSFNSTDGLVVGDMTTTLGNNTQITSSGVNIRNGSTVLASFEDDEIALGKNSKNSTISLCNNAGQIYVNSSGQLEIAANIQDQSQYPTILLAPAYYNADGIGHYSSTTIDPSEFYVSIQKGTSSSMNYGAFGVFSDSISLSLTQTSKGSVGLKIQKSDNNCYLMKHGEYYQLYGEKVLYNNTTGTTSTVTLSESAANFTYLEIFYNTNKNAYGSVKVYSPNGKKAQLSQTYWSGGTTTTQTDFVAISISGTTLSHGTEGYFLTTGTTVRTGTLSTPHFYITRVVGIK